jgi:peroxiredoxin
MNFLKSMFMTGYMMMTMLVSGYAAWMLYQGGNLAAWMGVMLTTAPIMMVLVWLMMFRNVARTSARFPLLNLVGLMGIALAVWGWFAQGADVIAPVLSVAGWIGFLLYAYWYSSFGRTPTMQLVIGAPLPDFVVTDSRGAALKSSSFTGKTSILVFYRGNWCPFCMAQVKELAARYKELGALGVRVALISPQPYNKNLQLAEKFSVNFEFLTDEDNVAARILQIDDSHGLPMGMQMLGYDSETVLPTVIITDKNGKVVWVHETDSYRIRPEPGVYLDVLRRHQLVGAQVPA